MTQIHGEEGVIKTYSNARKLSQIPDFPIGVMSYGIGNIGPRSILSFVREFGAGSLPSKDMRDISEALLGFIKTAYDTQFASTKEKPGLGFFLAGYSDQKVFAEEWEFVLPKDEKPRMVRPETEFGASWRGIQLPFTRLSKGFDPRIEDELRKNGLWTEPIQEVSQKYWSPFVFDGMPVQDAVNFAVYIVQTTIGLATFEVGPPTCGGPLQVATILPEDGFKWVLNPQIAVPPEHV